MARRRDKNSNGAAAGRACLDARPGIGWRRNAGKSCRVSALWRDIYRIGGARVIDTCSSATLYTSTVKCVSSAARPARLTSCAHYVARIRGAGAMPARLMRPAFHAPSNGINMASPDSALRMCAIIMVVRRGFRQGVSSKMLKLWREGSHGIKIGGRCRPCWRNARRLSVAKAAADDRGAHQSA